MKVALISLARRGGMVHYQAELANSLSKIMPVIAVCAATVSPSYYSKRVQMVSLDTGHGPAGSLAKGINPFTWWRLARTLQHSEADLFHVVGAHEWNPLLTLIGRCLGKPVVYTAHDPRPHRGAPIAMMLSNRLMTMTADAVVVASRYGRDQLLSDGLHPERVFHIPLGVYSSFAKRWRKGIRRARIILFFGRIEPYKGLDILISGFRQVADSLPDWRLMIAGTGKLPASARRTISARIRVVNKYLSDAEVASCMQQASMVVLPYDEATQSGVIATAYAFGRPVIVTKVGGLPEMVIPGKTGLVIPSRDAGALARAIKALASDSRRLSQMGRCAGSLAQAKWGWNKIARSHYRMYTWLLKESGTP